MGSRDASGDRHFSNHCSPSYLDCKLFSVILVKRAAADDNHHSSPPSKPLMMTQIQALPLAISVTLDSHLASLSYCFLICKMDIMVPLWQGSVGDSGGLSTRRACHGPSACAGFFLSLHGWFPDV
ncbi:Hypothetical predicted protein [Marmota monax]|uniref:Uncharacterized protein n=1 Tax=Marmota monax TaxID=9995 RepID=A0A5E4C1Y7_MARMO|nr:hypothetical protein GHT09_011147 [Marmota monax]VTJ75808.1 Hypothetical predicted protein [Marmota monax]